MSVDLLTAELAQLKERVAQLERAAFGAGDEYVEGWTRAARIVGVNARTCKRRLELGDFPQPCRIDTIPRKDGSHEHPTWRRRDLAAYAEGK